MSTSTPSVGIDHPTVVPTNFDPAGRDGEFDDPDDPGERDVDCEASGTDSDDTHEP
jgi:hypothetical protein